MTFYTRQGSALFPTDKKNTVIEDRLPAANYTIKQHPMTGALFLDVVGDFQQPPKLYGNTVKHAERIMQSFNERTVSTGVLLAGEKGSGKSLLAKELAVRCRAQDIPTLIINAPYHGEKFNEFIQSIDQPMCVLFDEFEKVYNAEQQTQMLTLLDGMYPTKKLFVLTCNDQYRIDSHMRNRPGRIYYSLNFQGLEEGEIRGYCIDKLDNQAHVDGVVAFSHLFTNFNFDMLKALVEEMNRFHEPANQAYLLLNARPRDGNESKMVYNVSLLDPNGQQLQVIEPKQYHGRPLDENDHDFEMRVYYMKPGVAEAVADKATVELANPFADDDDGDDDDPKHVCLKFRSEQTYLPGCVRGTWAFRNEQGFTLLFSPRQTRAHNWGDMF